jgi:hypothetical protein
MINRAHREHPVKSHDKREQAVHAKRRDREL